MKFDTEKLACAVANCDLGIRELSAQTEDHRNYFICFEDGKPHSWWEENMFDGPQTERMTDAQALSEIEAARRILQKHYDAGFLAGIWNDQFDGISYCYADGHYRELARLEESDGAA